MRSTTVVAVVLSAALFSAPSAEARDKDDCQQAWSQAVRSYLTKNRKADPKGQVPADLDGKELADQAWMAAFGPACTLEESGDKQGARIEAAMIGVQVLAKLDPRGCERFMQYYMDSTRGRDVCGMGASAGTAELRDKIAASIPKR